MTDRDFAGRSVFVTGAAGGLGRAYSLALAARGAHVWVADLDEDGARGLAQEVAAAGGSARAAALDVADPESWARAAREVEQEGPLHGLVNNAGVSLRLGIEETSVEQWDQVMAINLSSVFYGMKFLAPALTSANGASVVNVSSIAGMVGYFSATYGTSKWGVRGLSKVGALEFAERKVRVNSVHPGLTGTPLLHQAPDSSFVDASLRAVPEGRLASPDEIAAVVCFLLSDASSYVNGAELVADGGLTSGGLYHRILADLGAE
ncbi:SDR family NAD(P)-dependent oxidoreductase [Nocardioides sp. NPDC057577]|uniref:SDR family NAD(P)-dependent oxidoreductase n=1 Tax=Nocardioides sp. NPDC057577 TaxID=3346171 RepID=UPI00366D3067